LLVLLLFYTFTLGVARVYGKNIENSAVVYMYHRFGESDYPSTNITLEQFEEHLKEFSKEKYNVVSLSYIADSLVSGNKIPDNTIGISIDDAYKSILTKAFPLLNKYNFPFTIFVSTEPIDAKIRGYLTWDEIRFLEENGAEIGAHTRTHPHLHELDTNKVRSEIEYSNKRYLKELGAIPKLFAYPFGETSKEVIDILKDYTFTVAFGQHSGVINETSDFYYLPRFSLNEKYGAIDRVKFSATANGLGVYELLPYDPLLNENPPFIGFSLLDQKLSNTLNCFIFDSSGNAELKKFIFAERVELRINRKLKPGRIRMNCTAKDNEGWRWFGYQFIMPNYLD